MYLTLLSAHMKIDEKYKIECFSLQFKKHEKSM